MTNSNQLNKGAVTRFAALFICMIILCCIALPFIVLAYSNYVNYHIDINTLSTCIDGYYTFYYSSGQDIYNSFSSTTYFTDVYCACWDTSTQSYVICEVYSIYATRWTISNPFGSTTAYGWAATGRYNSNSFTIRSNNSGVTLYYQDTNGNITTHAPKLFYIKQGATCSRAVSNFKLTNGDWYQTGYTLSFDSQGGSSISPLTGVTGIVHLGESGEYYPQYVPAKPAHNFVGWSLTDNGSILWDVNVESNTTLYAIWEQNSNYCKLHFNQSGFYSDYECTVPISQTQYVMKGTTVNFWAKKDDFHGAIASDQWCHFYGKITIWDDNNRSTNYTGINLYPNRPKNDENVFEFSIRVDQNYDIHPVFAQLYRYNLKLITDDYNELKLSINNFHYYAGDTTTDGWWESRDYAALGTDEVLGVNFEFDIQLPFIIFDARIGLPDNVYVTDDNLSLYSDIIEDNSQYGAHINVHVVGNPYPYNMVDITTDVPTVFVYCKSIGEYDITHDYHPVIRYDESGVAQWNFEQVSLLDTDWSEVNDNIPTKLNSFFGGLFSLSGLAVLIPMVMMVSFAIWFIRRS